MACFHPVTGYRGKFPNPGTGRTPLVFTQQDAADRDYPIKIPCGRCIGCRLERSRQWAIRCVHEASMYENNCFITLTFAPEHLPKDGSLAKSDFQLFMKRLRKRFGKGVRYFHCGEYGEHCTNCGKARYLCSRICKNWSPTLGRPHYHACLFNFNFTDRTHWSTRDGVPLDTSQILSDLWGLGFCTVGDVTFESAAYVARYVTKKITGDPAENHYTSMNPTTGEIHPVLPEYTTMSRRPGIGRPWLDKYTSDVYPHDRVILRGREMRPPKYYDSQIQLANPETFDHIKESRMQTAKRIAHDNTYERLRVRETLQEIKLKELTRGYENE